MKNKFAENKCISGRIVAKLTPNKMRMPRRSKPFELPTVDGNIIAIRGTVVISLFRWWLIQLASLPYGVTTMDEVNNFTRSLSVSSLKLQTLVNAQELYPPNTSICPKSRKLINDQTEESSTEFILNQPQTVVFQGKLQIYFGEQSLSEERVMELLSYITIPDATSCGICFEIDCS